MFYRPDFKAVCADVIPFYENGEFKLFYLKDYRDADNHGEGCDWNLLTTSDLVNYVDHGTVLKRGSVDEQDLFVYTGCCCKYNNEYYIFYTGHNPHKRKQGKPEQKIMLAKSSDLLHWKKDTSFVLEAPDWLEMHDFRDPFIFYDNEKKCYGMLLAGRLKNENPANCRGVTLVAYSTNFMNWVLSRTPFFAPNAFYTHECPDLFKIGDWWYLIFSEFTDRFVTSYRMSRNLNGPWITPEINTFDGHAFYAAKSVFDGKRRFLFGWNPTKESERDNNLWQWGGNIVAHEIIQLADGTLRVKCPDEIKSSYSLVNFLREGKKVGSVKKTENGYIVGNSYGRSIKMLGKLLKNCKIELTLVPYGLAGDFGVILQADAALNSFYTVRFEPSFNRLAFDRCPRKDLFQHTSVDVERNCKLKIGRDNHIVILIQESILEVYVNDEVAMGTRMFDFTGDFGIYSMSTVTEFKNITLSEENIVNEA